LLTTLSDNTTVSYTDNTADSALGVGIPTTNTTSDPQLTAQLKAARQDIEAFLARPLIATQFRYTCDSYPYSDVQELPRPKLISLDVATYIDTSGTTQTLDPTIYTVDTANFPGRIVLQYGRFWPFTRSIRNVVSWDFTAGY